MKQLLLLVALAIYVSFVHAEVVKHPVEECPVLVDAWANAIKANDFEPRVIDLSANGYRIYMFYLNWLKTADAEEVQILRTFLPIWKEQLLESCEMNDGQAVLPDKV